MELDLNFILNNGIAIAVAWYVLTRLNVTLKELTGAINSLSEDINKRLIALEANDRLAQMKLHELKIQVDNLRRGDN